MRWPNLCLTLVALVLMFACADRAAQEYAAAASLLHSPLTAQLAALEKAVDARDGGRRNAEQRETEYKLLKSHLAGIVEARTKLGGLETPESCNETKKEFQEFLDFYEQFTIDKMAEIERELMKKYEEVGDIKLRKVQERSRQLNLTIEALARG